MSETSGVAGPRVKAQVVDERILEVRCGCGFLWGRLSKIMTEDGPRPWLEIEQRPLEFLTGRCPQCGKRFWYNANRSTYDQAVAHRTKKLSKAAS